MSQEAGGQVAVSAAPFLDNECGGKVGLFGGVVVEVNGQRVRQAVIGARHRLVIVPDLSPAEPVEDGIDVGQVRDYYQTMASADYRLAHPDRKSTRLNSSHGDI